MTGKLVDRLLSAQTQGQHSAWLKLAVLLLGLWMLVMDQTITAVVLPEIVSDLNATIDAASLTVTAFTVAAASSFVLMGRIADAIGRSPIVVIGLLVLSLSSLLTATAMSLPILIVGRVLQGFGLAAVLPASIGLIQGLFPSGRRRVLAFALWATVLGTANAIAPLLAGALTELFSWRAPFFLNIPLALVVAVAIQRLLSDSERGSGHFHLDVPGIVMLPMGMASLVFGLQQQRGVLLGLGVLMLTLFARIEHQRNRLGQSVLVDTRLLSVANYRIGIQANALSYMAFTSLVLLIPIFTQSVLGSDPFTSGLVLMIMGLGYVLGGLVASPLIQFFGVRTIAACCLALEVLVLFVFPFVLEVPQSPWQFAPGLMVYGLACGTGFAALTNLLFADIPTAWSSLASGLSATMRLAAASIGSALLVSLLTTLASDVDPLLKRDLQLQTGQRVAMERLMSLSSSSDHSGLWRDNNPLQRIGEQPSKNALLRLARTNLRFNFRTAFVLIAIEALLALLVILRLPASRSLSLLSRGVDQSMS